MKLIPVSPSLYFVYSLSWKKMILSLKIICKFANLSLCFKTLYVDAKWMMKLLQKTKIGKSPLEKDFVEVVLEFKQFIWKFTSRCNNILQQVHSQYLQVEKNKTSKFVKMFWIIWYSVNTNHQDISYVCQIFIVVSSKLSADSKNINPVVN